MQQRGSSTYRAVPSGNNRQLGYRADNSGSTAKDIIPKKLHCKNTVLCNFCDAKVILESYLLEVSVLTHSDGGPVLAALGAVDRDADVVSTVRFEV